MKTSKNKLSDEVTEHVARLAYIDIGDDEKKMFTKQMNSILEHFEMLKEVNTDGIEPTRHPMEITNVFREDFIEDGLTQEESLKNAPKKEKGFIIAPRII